MDNWVRIEDDYVLVNLNQLTKIEVVQRDAVYDIVGEFTDNRFGFCVLRTVDNLADARHFIIRLESKLVD